MQLIVQGVDVAGKNAVVTGGVSGIGLGIAHALAGAGMRVAITYRNEAHLREALPWFRARPAMEVLPVQLEITDRASCTHAAEEIERAFGPIHVLCNNAGIGVTGTADDASAEEWQHILNVNLRGQLNVLSAFLPGMLAHGGGGQIVNVASVTGFICEPTTALYATSKFALRGLTQSLRAELAGSGIGVSLLCPGLTRSRLSETAGPPTRISALLAAIAMCPDEVGLRTLRGIERNEAWIFTHSEFNDEIRELQDELLATLSSSVDAPQSAR